MKDHRFGLIPLLIEGEVIKSLNEIFAFVPKTIVVRDIGTNVTNFNVRVKNVKKWRLGELFQIAKSCSLSEQAILKLAIAELQKQSRPPSPKKTGVEKTSKKCQNGTQKVT